MALAKLFHSNKSLEAINMKACKIDSEGACHLAQALCENTTVRKLALCHNPIGENDATALAKLIHSSKSLEEVHMRFCSINSEGACHLAQALCENTSLRILKLSWNPIGQEGSEGDIHKLLEAMTVNSTLRYLILPMKCTKYAESFPRFDEVRSRVFTN